MSTRCRISFALACMLSASALHAQELPPRALARLGDYRFHHGASIQLVALSPDGSKVASAARKPREIFRDVSDEDRDTSFDRTVILWDAATGQRLRELQAPEVPVRSLVFSPDGKHLLVVSGPAENSKHIVLFDVASGKIVDHVGVFKADAERPQFSADGKHLIMCQGWDGMTSLELASMKPQQKWQAPAPGSEWIKKNEQVYHGVQSPDGRFIAWHAHAKLPDDPDLPRGLRYFIPPPSVVVMTDAVTHKVLYRKEPGSYHESAFVFSPDSRWFMIGSGKKYTAWDSATGKELFSLEEPDTFWMSVSPNGRWALAGSWPCRLWDLETKKLAHELPPCMVHVDEGTRGQLFSADGKTLVLWTESTLRVFDTATGKDRAREGHRAQHVSVNYSADGRTLFSVCRDTRCTWDVSPGRKPALTAQVQRKNWEASCGSEPTSPCNNSRFYLWNVNDQVCIHDTATGKVVHELEKVGVHRYWIGRFSPDATRLALCRDIWVKTIDKDGKESVDRGDDPHVLSLYDTRTGKKSGAVKVVNGMNWFRPVFSPDGRTIACLDLDRDVHLHDAVSGALIRTLRSTQALPLNEDRKGQFLFDGGLVFSPDGKLLFVTTADFENQKSFTLPICVFDVASGKEIRRFYGDPEKKKDAGNISCAACSPDNRLFAVADKDSATIRLIEIAGGTVRAQFKGHREGVHSLAFSPDGTTLASGGDDNVIYLWDVIGLGAEPAGQNPATEADLAQWWTDLADSTKAEATLVSLIRAGEPSVKVLSARLRPIEPINDKRLSQLFADLDADGFAARQSATAELSRLGDRVEDRLRTELKKQPSVEAKRRIEELLGKVDVSKLPSGTLQALRAIEVLERIGSSTALASLERLAAGAAEAWETRAARAAAGRLGKRTKMDR